MPKNFRSCNAVADFFLLHLDQAAGDSITNLKMQKMCYYAQGWSLALKAHAIFDEQIEAWAHGPAIPKLYRRFKGSGWAALDTRALVSDPAALLSGDDQKLLSWVWSRYVGFSGTQLEMMTHNEPPWKEAYGNTPSGQACNAEISHSSMRAYFSSLLASCDESDSRTHRSTSAESGARPGSV